MTLWNSSSATVHEEPPQMRAPPPLMRDHPSWPVVELFMYNLVLGLCKISPNTGRSGEKDDVETCWIPHGRCWGCLLKFGHRINAKCLTIHNTSVIFNFFGIFIFYFSRFFENLNSILWKNYSSRYPFTQVTRCNFWTLLGFSQVYQHMFFGKNPIMPKSCTVGPV